MIDDKDIEIAPLRAENEKRDDHFMNATLRANIAALADENDALRAKLAATEVDAARYRWLRNTFGLQPSLLVRGNMCDELDAAIDGARQQEDAKS